MLGALEFALSGSADPPTENSSVAPSIAEGGGLTSSVGSVELVGSSAVGEIVVTPAISGSLVVGTRVGFTDGDDLGRCDGGSDEGCIGFQVGESDGRSDGFSE